MTGQAMAAAELEDLARRLFGAYEARDPAGMAALLDDGLVSHITHAQAGSDAVEGRDAFMVRLPDVSEARLETRVTQVAAVDAERVMAMLEIRAERRGRTLHNFAAFLLRVGAAGRVAELWMVEALPADSDEFWAE
jgi:ketosteroid isomerase-like protein